MHKGTVKLSVLLSMWAVLSCLCLAMPAVIHSGTSGRTGMLTVHGQIYDISIEKSVVGVFAKTGEIFTYKAGNGDSRIFSSCVSDLEADGTDEILLIVGNDKNEYGEYLLILEPEPASQVEGKNAAVEKMQVITSGRTREPVVLKQIYKSDMKSINPWKVQTCDVDGDGRKEISAGVYKKTVFHPVMAKRPFIYNWTNGNITPKWLGSRLARPFDDYIFCDVNADGKDELVSTELTADGGKAVNAYAWKGFGFESIGGSGSYGDILEIRKASDSAVEINAVVNGRGKWITLLYKNGCLAERRNKS